MLTYNKRAQRVHLDAGQPASSADQERAAWQQQQQQQQAQSSPRVYPSTPTLLQEHAQQAYGSAKPVPPFKRSIMDRIRAQFGIKTLIFVVLFCFLLYSLSRPHDRPRPLPRKPLQQFNSPPPHVHKEPGADEGKAAAETVDVDLGLPPSLKPGGAVHEHPAAYPWPHEEVAVRRPDNFAHNGEHPAYNEEKLTPLFDRPHVAALQTPGLVTSFLSPTGRLKLSVLMSEEGKLGYMLDVAKPGSQKAGIGSAAYVSLLPPAFIELHANFHSCMFNTNNTFGAEVAWQLEYGESLWRPVPGNERRHFHESYQQAKVWCVGPQCIGCQFLWEYRLFDHALAIRAVVDGQSIESYTVSPQEDYEAEYARVDYGMEVRWPDNTESVCWGQNAEDPYVKRSCSEIQEPVMTPVTAILSPMNASSLPEGQKAPPLPFKYLSILQADGPAFTRSTLQTAEGQPNKLILVTQGEAPIHALEGQLGVLEHPQLGWSTPTSWNVIMVADSPKDLMHHNHLIYLLCPPPEDKFPMAVDSRWVGHGKSIRVRGYSTQKAKQLIDFAAMYNYQLIHFDAGWYGDENNKSSDPRIVHPDFHSELSMTDVRDYARRRGVGVTVYVNEMALKYGQELIDIYGHQWELAGIKFGFVDVATPRHMRILHQRLIAYQHVGLAVNIHDLYRPRGLTRTWPHLVTQEGVRGEERKPDATHHTILPFARYLQGAADYTPRYLRGVLRCTRAHQLALPFIFFSPIQSLFWAEPGQAIVEAVQLYLPELVIWQLMPTTWDDTRVLAGSVGEYASVARRTGQDWFVGTITNTESRTLTLNLSTLFDNGFDDARHPLPLGEQPLSNKHGWMVHMYEDDHSYVVLADAEDTAHNNRKVKLRQSFILPAKWSTAVHHRSKSLVAPSSAAFPNDPPPAHLEHMQEYRRRTMMLAERQINSAYKKETGQEMPDPTLLTSPLLKIKLAPSGGNVLFITPILEEDAT